MIERIYDINRVLELKEKLTNHLKLREYLGQQLTGGVFRAFIKDFNRLLPGKTREQVMRESLLHLAGVVLTPDILHETAWLLAGNIARIKAWHPATPWSRQVDFEYVPVQIVRARRVFEGHKHGAEFSFQVLAGTSAGCVLTKVWSQRLCGALARRVGFSNQRGGFPYMDVLQFVNLRLYVLIDPAKSAKAPDFEEVWQEANGKTIKPVSCFNYNRRYLRMRAGHEFACPKKFDRELSPCHLCPIGQEECLLAVHDFSYVKKACPGCSRVSWFDPAVPNRQVCVDCYHKSLGKRE